MSLYKHLKRRGHIYAVVRKPESVEHLAPNSYIHAVHRNYATQLKTQMNGLIITNITPPNLGLKFPSLAGGQTFDPAGCQITEPEYKSRLNLIRRERNFYVSPEVARKGGFYTRRRKCDPLRQLVVTAMPHHSAALMAVESVGVNTSNLIHELVKILAEQFKEQSPYELLAVSVHPEESMLHFHLAFSVVNQSHQLLHDGGDRGQPSRKLIGVGKIATLRLVKYRFWPESDGVEIDNELRSKTAKFGGTPIDYKLSMTMDEELDRYFFSTKDQRVETAYTVAVSAYFNHAKQIRSMRPDVLAAEEKKLKEELGLLKRRIAQLEVQANELTVERDRLVTFDLKVLREERDCLNAKVSALLAASRDDRWCKDRILESVGQLLAVATCLRDEETIPGHLLDNVRHFVRSKTGEWHLSDSVRTDITQCLKEHVDLDTTKVWVLVEQLDFTLEVLNAQPKVEWPLDRVLRLLEDMNEDIHREFQDGAREGLVMRWTPSVGQRIEENKLS
jgi:hypothetical protein